MDEWVRYHVRNGGEGVYGVLEDRRWLHGWDRLQRLVAMAVAAAAVCVCARARVRVRERYGRQGAWMRVLLLLLLLLLGGDCGGIGVVVFILVMLLWLFCGFFGGVCGGADMWEG